MDSLIDQLVRGSAEINRRHHEIRLVTRMLFGLAKHPGMWITAHTLDRRWERFHTRFGLLAKDGVWDVWWDGKSFQTRCLAQNEDASTVFCFYKSAEEPDALKVAYDDATGAEGIFEAHQRIEIFLRGMIDEFPLRIALRPFVRAAASA